MKTWVLLLVFAVFTIPAYYNSQRVKEIKELQLEHAKQAQEMEDSLKRLEEKLNRTIEFYALLDNVAACESSHRHEGIWGDGGRSYGFLQYQEATFYEHAKKAGLENANWKNKRHQIALFAWAIENGQGKAWTCYNKIKGV